MAMIPVTAAVRIVGCGRWSMGDDQAGLVVADRLLEKDLPRTVVVRDEAPGSELATGLSPDIGLLIIVDAAPADEKHPPGSSAHFDYRKQPDLLLPKACGSTHALSVDMGLELAETLGLLPKDVWIYAIFGKRFERGLGLSPATEAGIAPLVARIERDVRQWLVARPSATSTT